MAELETKKYSTDDMRPLLSLNPQKEHMEEKQSTKDEQEALWSRSLEFFETMKKSATQA